ncbi:beta-1,3-galactosyltransferase 5-like [Phlebotomus argentipes]|uniref:beta-1,3-galactosyltransferase 5-like n=1 Tax=Phlebotomus argentipes TaxID=94469 RepID=UPI0028934590|nr:beta-1,3-galactosyltransferase 5-like [Phlebotomus argentipes]
MSRPVFKTHFSKLFTRTSRFVIFMSLMAFFLFMCVKVLDFLPSEMTSEEFTTEATTATVHPLRPTEVQQSTETNTEATIVATSAEPNDDVADLEQRIDLLLKEFNTNTWLKGFTTKSYKLEGKTLAEDLYVSGFAEPNAMLCPDSGDLMRVLILITSAPYHTTERQAIRESWGVVAEQPDVVLAFVIGAVQNETLEVALRHENSVHGDLIRGNFVDSYKNLTLKTLSMLEWTLTFCPSTPYLLKTDDDMFVNTKRVMQFLEDHSQDAGLIFGKIARKSQPHRNTDSKWYLPEETFKHYMFPDFAFGPIYLLTGDTVMDLYKTALKTPFLWLEDVFLTGFVAQELGIPREDIGEVVKTRESRNMSSCRVEGAMAVHEVKPTEQLDFLQIVNDEELAKHCRELEELRRMQEAEEAQQFNDSMGMISDLFKNIMKELVESLELI